MTADMMCEYKVIRVVTADILGQAQLGLLSFRYDALFTVYKFRTCDEKVVVRDCPVPLIYSRLRPACIPSISIRTGERFERLRQRQMPRDTYSSSPFISPPVYHDRSAGSSSFSYEARRYAPSPSSDALPQELPAGAMPAVADTFSVRNLSSVGHCVYHWFLAASSAMMCLKGKSDVADHK